MTTTSDKHSQTPKAMNLGDPIVPVGEAWTVNGRPDPLIVGVHMLIGAPISRLDGPLKVQGKARFAAEFALDRMVYAALVFSTVAKGRISMLDTMDAETAPGVVFVMTYKNAPRLKPTPVFLTKPKAAGGDDLPVMQDERISWNGQPVAVVLAETQEQADEAAALIRVTFESETAATSVSKARAESIETGVFAGDPLSTKVGDADSALLRAAHKVDAIYRTPRHNQNAIEPHAATLSWKGDELFVHDATQSVTGTAWSLAQVFSLDEKQIHVSSPYVGGGFGGKTLWQHQVLAAAASKVTGRPVRIALSREGVYRLIGGRAPTEQRVALGADANGHLIALIHTGIAAIGRRSSVPEPFIMPSRSAYAAETFRLEVQIARLDTVTNTFMRAPGESVGSFALESAMDELAEELSIDPIELRIRNEPEKDPTSGQPFSSRHIVDAYKTGAQRFGWSQRTRPRSRREGEWLVGMGVATAAYPYERFPGGAARITLTRDGQAIVEVAAHEMGMGTSTVQSQIAATRLGLPLEKVSFRYGASDLPGMVIAGGSQQTASIGVSVMAAHRALVAQLLTLAGNQSPLSGLNVDEVGASNGSLCKMDEPTRLESYASILARANRNSITAEASAPPPEETKQYAMRSHGAIFCELRVSSITGEVRVTRLLGSYDCGRILNAKTATSQFRGGMIMGLGLALTEITELDERNGRIVNRSLAEYHVPVHLDVPEIEVIWTDIPDPHAPMGARGIGEIGITGTGAAVANAIYNATGKRVRDLPITLDKLL